MRIAVDTGGTFTDCVMFDGGKVRVVKVFSTPANPAQGVVQGLRAIEARSAVAKTRSLGAIEVLHGTTVGTNTVLERRGGRVALVTTGGFEDLIEIGRQNRPRLYDFDVQRQPPLVPRDRRFGIKERVGSGGQLLAAPSGAEIERLRRKLRRSDAESIAVCFLFSFANPRNEAAVAAALERLGLPLSVSHRILPEFREYERLSAVVINAYLAPRLGRYLEELEHAVAGHADRDVSESGGPPERQGRGRVFVMQSSGGITTAEVAAREPVRTILSGPAGGVVAAAWLARRMGLKRAISFDMGGTSTDVCLFEGAPRTTRETTLGDLPIAVPVLDIHSVGAGGGSLARIDAGGALRVGPESAGAEPGPACYGRGGTRPTVADANLLLGRLDADHFLGGTVKLDVGAAGQSFKEFMADSRASGSGIKTVIDLALGIIAVANATMERALRLISVERGHDPREFSLICFGGAGGLHAAELAQSLGLVSVVVPRDPGAFSALGILISDVVKDVSQSILLAVPPAVTPAAAMKRSSLWDDLKRRFARLEQDARSQLEEQSLIAGAARAERRLDVRCTGQSYELTVPFTPEFARQFHLAHERAYGYAHQERPIEIVNLRVRLTVPNALAARQQRESKARSARTSQPRAPQTAILDSKPVWWRVDAAQARALKTAFYERDRLPRGSELHGPAVLVEYSSTTAVPPGWRCRVSNDLNLVLSQARPRNR
jgi:N-methylhydantoinase A